VGYQLTLVSPGLSLSGHWHREERSDYGGEEAKDEGNEVGRRHPGKN
jgi:hypothetical protein